MKPWEFLLSCLLGAAVLLCAIMLILSGQNNRRIERILNTQQVEINKGQVSNQVGLALLQDMAVASANSPKMLQLLEKNGFRVNFNNQNGQQPSTPASGTPSP